MRNRASHYSVLTFDTDIDHQLTVEAGSDAYRIVTKFFQNSIAARPLLKYATQLNPDKPDPSGTY